MKSSIASFRYPFLGFLSICVLIFSAFSPLGIFSLDGPVAAHEFINFETPHVYPLDLTPDGQKLLAVNTADNRLEVFQVSGGNLTHLSSIPVGLDPVSVRARSNTEAWVVNHISDNVSIVDLTNEVVIQSIDTDNEPCDVVFAGTPEKAFVSCSEPNTVLVFDLNALNQAPNRIKILGEDPRMLAVSPDKSKVYGALFESGNGSTIITGRNRTWSNDAVTIPQSPYGAVEVPPNDGPNFNPPLNPSNPPPISVPIIVRKNQSGQWMDDNNGDWTNLVSGTDAALSRRVPGWDLPDRDIFELDANGLSLTYQQRLMTMVMALAVKPNNGHISVIGTDASNEIRYEPNINGTFLTVNLAQYQSGGSSQVSDLNPHLSYSSPQVPQIDRDKSLGDPRGLVWNLAGTKGYVTGMGSDNVVVLDGNGARSGAGIPIEVGQGPTGIVLLETANRAFVLNKFDGSISILDLTAETELSRVSFYDPTPQIIKDGRPLLYSTHTTSGLGQAACASCHVDARTDQLAWDLGNPAAPMDGIYHPMKGPLRTQTLQDIIRYPSMHHRGDRNTLFDFAGAFVSLQGANAIPSSDEMVNFESFLSSIYYPPNPYRNLDNSLSNNVPVPGPNGTVLRQANSLLAVEKLVKDCNNCHVGNRSRSLTTFNANEQVACNLRGIYDRLGLYYESQNGSTQGFGLRPEGSSTSSFKLHHSLEMLAVLMQFDGSFSFLENDGAPAQDVHAAIGKQITLNGSLPMESLRTVEQLKVMADFEEIGLIVKGMYETEMRGFYYLGNDLFQSDRSEQTVSYNDLLNAAAAGSPLSFTAVHSSTRVRMGVDRDADGIFDLDEDELGLSAPESSSLIVSAQDSYEIYINGILIGAGEEWQTAEAYHAIRWQDGNNVIAIKASNNTTGGFLAELKEGGLRIGTDNTWKVASTQQAGWSSSSFDDSGWSNATEYGAYGVSPWDRDVLGMAYDTPAKWIWSSSNSGPSTVYLRYTFTWTDPSAASCTSLFTEDFSSGLSQWNNTGGASTSSGKLLLSGAHHLRSNIGNAWQDYAVSAQIRVITGAGGLIFRRQDGSNFYLWQIKEDGNLLARKQVNGNWESLASLSLGLEPNQRYELRIDCTGPIIRTYLNQNLVHILEDISLGTGKIGLYQEVGESAEYDDITVCDRPYAGSNRPPVALFQTALQGGASQFDASTSADSDGSIASYSWDFGDGSQGSGLSPTHSYGQSGDYLVSLLVTDNEGAVAEYSETISVGCPTFIRTYVASEDAHVRSNNPTANFGTGDLRTRVRRNSTNTGEVPLEVSYLRFQVADLEGSGASIRSVRLLLHEGANAESRGLFKVFETTSTWDEGSVTWNTRPSLGSTEYGTWVGAGRDDGEVYDLVLDPAMLASGDGTYSLALYPYRRTADPRVTLQSRESAHPPRLIVEFENCAQNYQTCGGIFSNISPSTYTLGRLEPESASYTDRIFEVLSMPSPLRHAEMIQTANDDKNNSSNAMVSFDLLQDATLYVVYDSRATSLPTWLQSWDDTGLTLATTDINYLLYSKEFSAGAVSLEGNLATGAAGANSNYFVLGDCRSIPVNPPSSFPVEWMEIEAELIEEDGHISWITAAEINNEHFEVQRSLDGREFEMIGEVAAIGNSVSPTAYQYVDPSLLRFQEEVLYYRIRQVDLNGQDSYSPTVALSIPHTEEIRLQVYPNPVAQYQQLDIELQLSQIGVVSLQLFNLDGQLIQQEQHRPQEFSTHLSLSLERLARGMYILRVSGEDWTRSVRVFVR